MTGTARDGTVLQNQCLPEDEEKQRNYNIGGGVAIAAGAALVGLAVIDLVRAADSTELRQEPIVRNGSWQQCGTQPDAGRALDVLVPGGGSFEKHVLEVRADGHQLASFDLVDLPLMAMWRDTVAGDLAAQQGRVAASEAIREERTQDALRSTSLQNWGNSAGPTR